MKRIVLVLSAGLIACGCWGPSMKMALEPGSSVSFTPTEQLLSQQFAR